MGNDTPVAPTYLIDNINFNGRGAHFTARIGKCKLLWQAERHLTANQTQLQSLLLGEGFANPISRRTRCMKLTEKYELVEPVTSGRINSFIARNLATSEQAVVHLFECAKSKTGQPAAVWVLQAFRCIAPSPPGVVSEAGTSETGSLAYVITSMPTTAALRAWVQAYKISTETTQEFDEGKAGSTASIGEVMRQAIELNIQPTSEPKSDSTVAD
jgi:hypothetical protein